MPFVAPLRLGVDRGWCPAWSSKPVGVALEAASVGSIPMHSRHFSPMASDRTDPLTDGLVAETLLRFIAETFRDGRSAGLTAQTPLVTSGIVDSTGVLELVDFLESEFRISVAPGDVAMANFNSLDALTAYVMSRLPAEEPGSSAAPAPGPAAKGPQQGRP